MTDLLEANELTPVELPKVIDSDAIDSPEESVQTDVQAEPGAESGELEVSIEGESPPPVEEQDSSVIREMRKALREKEKAEKAAARRAKELEAELEAIRNPKQELGPKPTLESVDYDAEAFEAALLKWSENKRKADSELEKQKEAQKVEQQVYAERLERYQAEARELKLPNFDDAEAAVRDALNVTQQSVLVRYSEKPAAIVAALAGNPDTAKRLAAISDPIAFALAVKDLESKVKLTPRKPPAPESKVTSSGRSIPYEARLKELQAAADRTGDGSEVLRFLRAQKKA